MISLIPSQYKKFNSNKLLKLDFNHPIKEFIWTLRRTEVGEFKTDPCNCNKIISYGNDWFNFSDTIGTIHGFNDTFDKAIIQLNGSNSMPV